MELGYEVLDLSTNSSSVVRCRHCRCARCGARTTALGQMAEQALDHLAAASGCRWNIVRWC